MSNDTIAFDSTNGDVTRGGGLDNSCKPEGFWEITCRDKNGNIKWTDVIHNLVTNLGKNLYLDVTLGANTAITTWYVGLTAGTPTVAAGDTMASHAGWTEVTAYTQTARVTWVGNEATTQSITNADSKALFTINTNATTVGGSFLTSVNTKGGTTGTLFAVGAFSAGNKTLDNGDTLEVTSTFNMT